MDKLKFFKSIIDSDQAPVVICNLEHIVVYMNKSAIMHYKMDITGKSIKECHTDAANEKIDRVVEWFKKDKENNTVFTYHNPKEKKDVYMVALRDDEGTLIGYYEKHEYRTLETQELYKM